MLQLALIILIVWIVYVMLQSYRSMEKELREIRMKCMGTASSQYTNDPIEAVKGKLVEGLTQLALKAK